MLMTLRGIDENGKWLPKQKKIYLTDEYGERIPIIDKKTGQQKVDKQNRKQRKCQSVPTNDWSSKENARRWRINLTETINSVNQSIGMTENFWEHRSFKEQGLDIQPQIHLGTKASALERAGIHTIRGDINRSILSQNAIILQAKIAVQEAKKNLSEAKAIITKGSKGEQNMNNQEWQLKKFIMKHPEYCDEYASGNLSINLYCDIMRNTPSEIIAVSDLPHSLMQLRTQLAKSWKITDPRAEVKRAEYQRRPSRSPAKKREESL